MPSIKIILYNGKTYKDNRNPVAIQIIHNRKRKLITLGLSALTTEWIKDIQRFSSKTKNYKSKNQTIEFFEQKAESIFSEITKKNLPFSFELFESMFRDNQETKSLYNLYDIIIKELKEGEKISTANIYQSSYNSIQKYTSKKDIALFSINYNFLKGFENFLIKQGNSGGGIHHQMRTLRAVINESIRRGYLESRYYPFSTQFNKEGYSLSHLKSKASPRALSEADLEKFKQLDILKHPHLKDAKNYFLFSYYSRGINFVDMIQLKWSDIYNNRLIYNRSKTSKSLNIKLSDNLNNIIQNYKPSASKYIFPVLNEKHKTQTQIKYRTKKCLKAYNLELKEIATILKISINLTSYVARHTYATTLKRKGISTEVISEALGHSELATTKAYLEKFSNDIIDEADVLL